MVNVRKKEAGGRGREGRGPGVQEGGTHLEGKTERGPKEEGRRKSEGAVEEAEDQEWRRKRMGLTWRARQREGQRKRANAKARGCGGRGHEGRGPGVEVQEGGQ